MDKGLKSLIAALAVAGILSAGSPAVANENCGTSIQKVIDVMKEKFPNANHDWVENFIGRWINDGDVVSINRNSDIILKGYRLAFCPYNGNRFKVLANGSDIGSLVMKGRNTIEVATNTMLGTIYMDREGSVAARRRAGN